MSNKKQIHLKTIQLNLCFVPPDSPSYASPPEHPNAPLTISTSHRRPVHSTFTFSNSASKIKTNKPPKKNTFLLNRLQQLQLHQHRIEKYTPSRAITQVSSYYQQFPRRQSSIKNSNPFKFFLNSATAAKTYAEQIAPLHKLQLKLSEINLRKSPSRPVTGKVISKTEHISSLLEESRKSRRPISSSLRQSLQRKRQKCVTAPTIDAWQTKEQRYICEW